MEALRNSAGFFGPSLLADITLVVQILFYLVLCAGVVAQLQGRYKWHDRLQGPVVILNLFFIAFVMIPTFTAVVGSSGPQIPRIVTIIHGILGTLAQGLAIYCLLAGLRILPRNVGVLRYWMWAAFTAWTVTIIFGIGIYIIFYTPALAAPSSDVVTEHDADLSSVAVQDSSPEATSDGPAETVEAVAEHAEESAVEESSQQPVATEVAEETVAEHDEAPVVVAPTVSSESGLSSTEEAGGTTSDQDTFPMEELISEHEAEVVEITEPEFTGEAAQAEWQQLQAVNAGPGARYQHAMAYNAATNQLFVFGGRDGSQIFNDVWALDMELLSWRQIGAASPAVPPARFSTVMMVDEAAENLYVATGHTQGGQNFSDVWKLNLVSERWQELTASAGQGPQARYGGPGGSLGGNMILTHGFGATRYDDTWRFNIGTEQWENITPAGAVPLRRCLFAAAPGGANLVIHGGCASGFGDCFLDDTWVLDTQANAWREVLSDIKPVGRQYQTLVSNASNTSQIVLFGGQDASRAARDDLWFLDLASGSWQLGEAPAGPAGRYQHASVWIPGRGMLVYGGRNNDALNDLWLLGAQPTAAPAPTAPPAQEPTSTPLPPPPAPTPTPTPTAELISEHDGG